MRFYAKLALIVLAACGSQAAISSGSAAETYFALRCLAATTTGDCEAEARLVRECQQTLRLAERDHGCTTVLAYYGAASR